MYLISKDLTCGTCHFCKVPQGSAKASRFRTLMDGDLIDVAISGGRPVENRLAGSTDLETLADEPTGKCAHLRRQ
jgi:hypothetical protein